ncbi:unnamed protein product [Polarella glacialis]|uniref:Uncharacterized protein n=1 Tax=Polarella glacialis TaxID=89957 RepID=A0A813LZU5_POLGL|nr:unnamed protein product [Polarella glacialis]CAE8742173.1 unnamed protein product [Polarella glacialis]
MASLLVQAANQEGAMKATAYILDFVATKAAIPDEGGEWFLGIGFLRVLAQEVAAGGLNIDSTDVWEMTLMHYAARLDYPEVVKVLASAAGSSLSGSLHVATSLSMVMLLVELGADLNEEVSGGNIFLTALMHRPLSPFVEGNNLDIVRYLVSAKSNPHARLGNIHNFRSTALHIAVATYHRSLDMVKFLIDEVGADVFERNERGKNAMEFASEGCNMTFGNERKQAREFVKIIKRGACRQFAAFMEEHRYPDYVSKETVSRLEECFWSGRLSCPACSAACAETAHFCHDCGGSLGDSREVDTEVRFIKAIVCGREISASGGEFDAVMQLQAALKDAGLLASSVKTEPGSCCELEHLGQQSLNLNDVAYTQTSISERFRDGRPLTILIDALNSGRVSLSHPQLRISVIDWPGRGLKSIDNRRLNCFRRHQEYLSRRAGAAQEVFVQADVYRLPESFIKLAAGSPFFFERFLKHYEQDGAEEPFIRSTRRRHG